ncbi:MAG: prepilin-type N-terminal cleavage/methylation domain-containing protein, partial [Gemmatimonadales bacterium]
MKAARGFTLVELLVVVVVIGVLASIAIPKFSTHKEKSYVAQMKSDLRNLATAEEAYFYDSTAYTANLAALGYFNPSQSVTIT